MTPGYGFAYFRSRKLRYRAALRDETDGHAGMQDCRYLDYAKFSRFQDLQ